MKQQSGGFIQLIIVLVIALLVLGYYGFDLKNFIDSPGVQKTLGYLADFFSYLWHAIMSSFRWLLSFLDL
jgi:hypothetical protein